MQLRYLITCLTAMSAMAVSVWAAPPTGADKRSPVPGADLYISPAPDSGLVIPSGVINISPHIDSDNQVVSSSITTAPAPVGDVTNLLGCGGVGQGEYTSAVYNMPESFGKFQQDVNSLLSRQILTMNYIMPQTAALFDQLNTYGNDRYQTFQQGCKVEPLKQDARSQYLNACVAKLIPERMKIIQETMTGENLPKEPLLSSMAYAQAWEICSNQYVSDTNAPQIRNDALKAFAEQTRAVENATLAVKNLICRPNPEKATDSSNPGKDDGYGCWASYLLPQVRLCLDGSLQEGCKNGEYGMREPIVSMPHLFDTMRFIVDDELVARRVVSVQSQINRLSINPSMQTSAASEAALLMSTATIARMSSSTATVSRMNALPDESIIDYQLHYLGCRDPLITGPLDQLIRKLRKNMTDANMKDPAGKIADISMDVLDAGQIQVVLRKMKLPGDDKDFKAFAAMVNVSLGCAVNQTIPILDPNLVISLNLQCTPQDRAAFYAVAGYDVAQTATRDAYRYLNLRLKQAYTRLMTEDIVPVSNTTATTSPTISRELNNRLATAVKDIMIPYVESQIARLDEITNTRNTFAQRVQQIYSTRSGCISGVAPVPAPKSSGRYVTGGGGGGGGGGGF